MATNNVESIKKEIRGYVVIFIGIVSLSLTAVLIHYLHLPLMAMIVLTILIAAVQVFLAAGYFMHLISEKKLVLYIVLTLTAILVLAVLILPSIEHHNTIPGTVYTNVS
jgi:heme/copper-type cytochrome/quinol oxidase subunit 4